MDQYGRRLSFGPTQPIAQMPSPALMPSQLQTGLVGMPGKLQLPQNIFGTFDTKISAFLEPLRSAESIRTIIIIVLILYATYVAPSLPTSILAYFNNQYFRLFIIILVLWAAKFTPSVSILIAIIVMISINYATEKKIWEFIENIQEQKNAQAEAEAQVEATEPVPTPAAPGQAIPATALAPTVSEITGTSEFGIDNYASTTIALGQAVKTEEAQAIVDTGCYPARQYDLTNITGYEP